MDCGSIRVIFAYTFARCRAESIVAVLSTTLAAQRPLDQSFTDRGISKVLAIYPSKDLSEIISLSMPLQAAYDLLTRAVKSQVHAVTLVTASRV